MDASNGPKVEYTSDGEISEQLSVTVRQSLSKLVKKKINILLMGQSRSGKTSMRSIVFENYQPVDTKSLCATDGFEDSHVQIFGNLVLNIRDCGGQETFDDNYFSRKRNSIFHKVDVVIYVFDLNNRDEELASDLKKYQTCINAIYEHSPSAQVFCLMNKMDVVAQNQRKELFEDREIILINISKPMQITCFMTSILDESLYGAWSSIIRKLVPNIEELEKSLKHFADVIECYGVILFDRATVLVLAKYVRVPYNDMNRFQNMLINIKNIRKKYKKSCSELTMLQIKQSKLTVIVKQCSVSTYLMVLTASTSLTELTLLNIKQFQLHLEKLKEKMLSTEAYNNS